MRYDITARSDSTRIRYPEGMSWLTAGSLRLTGTTDGGVLSGRVTVERVTLTQGLEVAGALSPPRKAFPVRRRVLRFLRNLQFDIRSGVHAGCAHAMAGRRARSRSELARARNLGASHHSRATSTSSPATCLFHGNRYKVARGDINFANPFRLDPVVNVEASTTIQQYEITLNFNGPASKLTLAYRSDPPLPGTTSSPCWRWGKPAPKARRAAPATRKVAPPGPRRFSRKRSPARSVAVWKNCSGSPTFALIPPSPAWVRRVAARTPPRA